MKLSRLSANALSIRVIALSMGDDRSFTKLLDSHLKALSLSLSFATSHLLDHVCFRSKPNVMTRQLDFRLVAPEI
jgi:hypothetical protein